MRTQEPEAGRELPLQLCVYTKSYKCIHRGAFDMPPTGRARKATLQQSSTHFAVLASTGRPCRALGGVVTMGTHSSQSPPPASTNGCSPVLERQ